MVRSGGQTKVVSNSGHLAPFSRDRDRYARDAQVLHCYCAGWNFEIDLSNFATQRRLCDLRVVGAQKKQLPIHEIRFQKFDQALI